MYQAKESNLQQYLWVQKPQDLLRSRLYVQVSGSYDHNNMVVGDKGDHHIGDTSARLVLFYPTGNHGPFKMKSYDM